MSTGGEDRYSLESPDRLPRSAARRTLEAPSHGLCTPCVRFTLWVAPRPRNTRFRLLGQPGRTGLVTRWVPLKGFCSLSSSPHLTSLPPFPRAPRESARVPTPVGCARGEVGGVVERKYVDLVKCAKGSGSGERAGSNARKELGGRAVAFPFHSLGQRVDEQHRGIDVEHPTTLSHLATRSDPTGSRPVEQMPAAGPNAFPFVSAAASVPAARDPRRWP